MTLTTEAATPKAQNHRVPPTPPGFEPSDRRHPHLRPRAFADKYDVAMSTVYRWLAEGKLRSFTMARTRLIEGDSIAEFIEAA